MRYDTKITFYKDNGTGYDPRTSKHIHKLISWYKWANVTDLSTKKQVELLGGIKQGMKNVRLSSKINEKWDYLTIADDSTHYRFNSSVKVLKGFAMIVGQDNG